MSKSRNSLTLSRITTFALMALAVGCGAPETGAKIDTAGDPAQAALSLPAGPPESPMTVKELGFSAASLGTSGTPLYLSGHVPAAVHDGPTAAQAVLRNLTATYRLAGLDTLKPLTTEREDSGRLFVKLAQQHEGVPVLHHELIVQADADGAMAAVLGELAPDLRVDMKATRLDGDTALLRGLSTLVAAGQAVVHEAPTLAIFAPTDGEEGGPVLGYRALVEYMGQKGRALEELVVRASDGVVLERNSHIYDALSRTVSDYGGKCLGLGTPALPGTLKRSEGDAKVMDEAVNRIYDNVGATYWFYKHFNGRDSYDNMGAPLVSSAHVMFLSFPCTGDNAAWLDSPYFQMAYGDGDGMLLLDLSLGLDVSSHELTHAVTGQTSKLVYKNESGALNEAMSDILGSSAEAWLASGGGPAGNPASFTATTATWQIGEKVAGPMLPGGALRFMNNPTADMQSTDYYPERYTGTQDNGGVHLNSGIANLAFYLLSQGGPHPRAKTSTTVPGIGIEKAARIFYLTDSKLLTSSATFQSARFASAQAAQNLYGRCSTEWQNVHMAWDAVGVPGTWIPCVSPLPGPGKF